MQAENISLIQLLNGKGGGERVGGGGTPPFRQNEPSELLRRLKQPALADSPASR
ncbi:MAG: hypothetical protein ACK56I_25460 [bacterium]